MSQKLVPARRRRAAAPALLLALGALLSACGGDDDQAAESASTESSAVQETQAQVAAPEPSVAAVAPPATTSAAVPPTTAAPEPVATFAMPDFIGLDLQTAQNLVQDNGVFLSVSHDLLGSRNQLVDSNWMVCTQNIPAGQPVATDAEGQIDFGVVKREERCP